MSRWENRLSTFCSLLDTMVPTDKRVAAFTSDIEEAAEMWKVRMQETWEFQDKKKNPRANVSFMWFQLKYFCIAKSLADLN